jgi:hypothetical protein
MVAKTKRQRTWMKIAGLVDVACATIEFDRGAHSCAVRNLSEAGAALDVPCALAIPHEFTLTVVTDQVNRHCRVIWRKENRLGVAFAQVDNQPEL